jgi:hypothetical protein
MNHYPQNVHIVKRIYVLITDLNAYQKMLLQKSVYSVPNDQLRIEPSIFGN